MSAALTTETPHAGTGSGPGARRPGARARGARGAGLRGPVGTALLTLALGAGLVAALPGAASAVTPTRPPLPAAVEDLQPYIGQEGCDPVAKPGVLAFQAMLMNTYRDTGSLGIVRDCGIGGQSEHKEGRAFDWAVSASNPTHVAEVATVTDWLTAFSGPDFASNARRLGIMYMIWNQRIWKAYQPELGWQGYTGPDPHTGHVHFSFGWNAAKKATSWWTGAVAPLDYGPYTTSRPPAPVPPQAPPTLAKTPIDVKHDELGGDGGRLGVATGPEADVLNGRYRPYVGGAIYWSPSTGAHEVHGDIQRRYLALGGSRSVLGLPTSDESPVTGGVSNTFQYGAIMWSPATGPQALYGGIYGTYRAMRGPDGRLRLPVREEADVVGGRGALFQGGRLYWSAATGAHEVSGGILDTYLVLGGESGYLRLPTTDEVDAGPGRSSGFQGGGLYWSPATGVHAVQGGIREKWLAVGGPGGFLGMPRTNEGDEPGGRSSTFTGGRIFWSPATGARMVFGAVLGRYLLDGAVGRYGFPRTDEYASATGTSQEFERAFLDYNASTGAVTVRLT